MLMILIINNNNYYKLTVIKSVHYYQ